jgi:large subunit ribosomal protein L6
MSRIGKKLITVPAGVTITSNDASVTVKGPKGELSITLHPSISVTSTEEGVRVAIADETDNRQRALWGTFGSLLRNMITGVTTGYSKQLEINGVGFKWAVKGKTFEVHAGFSHPVAFPIPEGITITSKENSATVEGIDKQLVGETAAQIRSIKKPEPYLGKGIKYSDEVILRKAGKTAASA